MRTPLKRARACLSVRGLADASNVAPSTIWRVEHNRHVPTPTTRRRLAEALGLDWNAISWPH